MDLFADDPAVLKLEAEKRKAGYLNWQDQSRRFTSGVPDLEHVGPCSECGSTEVAHEGVFEWSCAECGTLRFVLRFDKE